MITPAPWKIVKSPGGYILSIGGVQASRYDRDNPCLAVSVDDARLIAAAPDLLEACRAMRQAMRDYEMDVDECPPQRHVDMMRLADKAIAKAGA